MIMPRLLTAMITPYDNDMRVNYPKAAEIAQYLVDNGTQGVVVCGTTGESPVLSEDEKIRLFATVKERVGSPIPVWANTGGNNTAQSIRLSREAEKTGVDGIMAVTPYYNKPTQEGLYQHFKAIAESVSLPVMLYNVPGRTSCNLLPSTVERLSAVENIVAVKEASGDMDQTSLLVSTLPPKVKVYSGDDSMTLPMMALGAYGVVSIASHLVGKDIQRMIDAFVQGEPGEAARIHLALFPIFKGLFMTTNPVPLKAALNMLGMDVGGLRLPLVPVNEEERASVREMLRSSGLL